MYTNPKECWEAIPGLIEKALKSTPKDFVALECCANGQAYAKPDTLKWLLLWEASRKDPDGKELIEIDYAEDVPAKHQWMYELFIQDDFVRFPWNSGDCSPGESMDWHSIDPNLARVKAVEDVRLLPRFSTASRSNLALIPETFEKLSTGSLSLDERKSPNLSLIFVNLTEWNDFARTLGQSQPKHPESSDSSSENMPRAYELLTDIGKAVSQDGVTYQGENHRLYSVKTGVSYVGSTNEPNKQKLESNSMLAMLRSKVIRQIPHRDPTFDIQTELLTVLAPTRDRERDGFQVRDLSCMKSGLNYLPAQAIPYVIGTYNQDHNVDAQVTFWRQNFAVPMGRAKACLFLKYGLIHTSANAQNFVLGFSKKNELQHFVVRDIGDTSWHDDYLDHYLRNTQHGAVAWSAYLLEKTKPNSQTLYAPSYIYYQSPRIVRLAANSVLTHHFGEKLGQGQWQAKHLHRFASGVLDGFRAYIEETFELTALYPDAGQGMEEQQIQEAGREGVYPYPIAHEEQYRAKVDVSLEENSQDLFARAAFIHGRAGTLLDGAFAHLPERVSVLINAEELFLCAGIDKLLREWREDGDRTMEIQGRIDAMNGVRSWSPII